MVNHCQRDRRARQRRVASWRISLQRDYNNDNSFKIETQGLWNVQCPGLDWYKRPPTRKTFRTSEPCFQPTPQLSGRKVQNGPKEQCYNRAQGKRKLFLFLVWILFWPGDKRNILLNFHFCINYNISLMMVSCVHPARALRALGLLLADGAPTVGGGKTF